MVNSNTSSSVLARRTTHASAATPKLFPALQVQLVRITRLLAIYPLTTIQAALYDIGTKLNTDPMAKWKIPSLSPLALALSSFPSALEWNLESQGYNHRVGTHTFAPLSANTSIPTFAFDQLTMSPFPIAQVGKLNETAAPESACPGLQGEGTVKWLYLKDTKGLSKGGVDTVYRLETAGGMAPKTCEGRPKTFEVKYAAQCKSCSITSLQSCANIVTDWVFGPRK